MPHPNPGHQRLSKILSSHVTNPPTPAPTAAVTVGHKMPPAHKPMPPAQNKAAKKPIKSAPAKNVQKTKEGVVLAPDAAREVFKLAFLGARQQAYAMSTKEHKQDLTEDALHAARLSSRKAVKSAVTAVAKDYQLQAVS